MHQISPRTHSTYTPASHTPASQDPAPRARPAPPRRPIGGAPPRSWATAEPGAAADRSTSRDGTRRRRVLLAAGGVVLFLACLALVLLGARAAAAGGRPLPAAPILRIQPDPPLSLGQPLVTLPWGVGPGAVGLDPLEEGLRRAPWALAVAADGRIAVLDAVKRRVVCLDAQGRVLAHLPVALSDPRFIAVDETHIHVLDPDVDRRLASLDWQGTSQASLALPPLDDPVSGLFCRDGAPLIETAHRDVFTVQPGTAAVAENPAGGISVASDGATRTATPPRAPGRTAELAPTGGRPLGAGTHASARCVFSAPYDVRLTMGDDVLGTNGGAADPQAAAPAGVDIPVRLPWAVEHLVSLDGDSQGNLVIGARLLERRYPSADAAGASTATPTPAGGASLVVTRLPGDRLWSDPSAPPTSEPEAPALMLAGGGTAEIGAPFVVGPDGRVYQPRVTEDGYTILVHSFTEE